MRCIFELYLHFYIPAENLKLHKHILKMSSIKIMAVFSNTADDRFALLLKGTRFRYTPWVKIKLSLCFFLTEHHAMKVYGGVEV
jgi:hypothetical protein